MLLATCMTFIVPLNSELEWFEPDRVTCITAYYGSPLNFGTIAIAMYILIPRPPSASIACKRFYHNNKKEEAWVQCSVVFTDC